MPRRSVFRVRSRLATAALGAGVLLASLSGCSLIRNTVGAGDAVDPGEDNPLVDTIWAGTDSEGYAWVFELQDDGTLAFSLDGSSYDDASDLWTLTDDELVLHIAFDEGDIDFTGDYRAGDSAIDLHAVAPEYEFELTVTTE